MREFNKMVYYDKMYGRINTTGKKYKVYHNKFAYWYKNCCEKYKLTDEHKVFCLLGMFDEVKVRCYIQSLIDKKRQGGFLFREVG